MAKSIGKFMGVGNNSTSTYGSETDILKYLNEYDTSQVDSAYKNMASLGNQLSTQLSERPNYVYSVNASDAIFPACLYNSCKAGIDDGGRSAGLSNDQITLHVFSLLLLVSGPPCLSGQRPYLT